MSRDRSRLLQGLGRDYVRHVPGLFGKSALVRGWLNPQLREHPQRRVARTPLGARFLVDTQDLIQRYLYLFGGWEPHLTRWLQRRLKPGDGFVDVGANIGYFSVLASQLVGPSGSVVAVEASPEVHRRLEFHARLNGCRNIRAVHAGVSDKEERLTFVLASSRNSGANSVVPYEGVAEAEFEIEARPLPRLLSEREIERARVIKIDVEGAEGAVVRSLRPVLKRLRPDAEVVVEVTPERMQQLGDRAEELMRTFTDRGFHAYRLANDYDPGSYPAAIRRPRVPVRWRGPITEEMDVIFSRVDAETLP